MDKAHASERIVSHSSIKTIPTVLFFLTLLLLLLLLLLLRMLLPLGLFVMPLLLLLLLRMLPLGTPLLLPLLLFRLLLLLACGGEARGIGLLRMAGCWLLAPAPGGLVAENVACLFVLLIRTSFSGFPMVFYS